MGKTIETMRNALKAFGCSGSASIEYLADDRIYVIVNGEYFGIWDALRNTFVD
jgi:hypothetical protein